jgi:hypothetical protein
MKRAVVSSAFCMHRDAVVFHGTNTACPLCEALNDLAEQDECKFRVAARALANAITELRDLQDFDPPEEQPDWQAEIDHLKAARERCLELWQRFMSEKGAT